MQYFYGHLNDTNILLNVSYVLRSPIFESLGTEDKEESRICYVFFTVLFFNSSAHLGSTWHKHVLMEDLWIAHCLLTAISNCICKIAGTKYVLQSFVLTPRRQAIKQRYTQCKVDSKSRALTGNCWNSHFCMQGRPLWGPIPVLLGSAQQDMLQNFGNRKKESNVWI